MAKLFRINWIQITACLKRAFKYSFCTKRYTLQAIAEEADMLLFRKVIAFLFCCHLFNLASIALDLKDIHISYPDVNMNYIKSPTISRISGGAITLKPQINPSLEN